jgi:protein-S-isoprenylcysteine O-methyltransferase Ste14
MNDVTEQFQFTIRVRGKAASVSLWELPRAIMPVVLFCYLSGVSAFGFALIVWQSWPLWFGSFIIMVGAVFESFAWRSLARMAIIALIAREKGAAPDDVRFDMKGGDSVAAHPR